jgi:hypothetical protein
VAITQEQVAERAGVEVAYVRRLVDVGPLAGSS